MAHKAQSSAHPGPGGATELEPIGAEIVQEELGILERVRARVERQHAKAAEKFEDLDGQLIELRDAISEAKEEDLPSLIDQMHQVAALRGNRGKGRSLPIDPKKPYFGHLRLREARHGKVRDVLIGKRTLLDDGDGLSIVDWRNAPVSRLYYRYEEDDEYEEEFDERSLEGTVVVRRSIGVAEGELHRVASPQGTFVRTRAGHWRAAQGALRASLEGGSGKAARVPRGQLGVADEDRSVDDKHLQEITALIDREQFGLITQPESGVVLIQGGAGSGKTTVALHRVAYLAFQDGVRFAPSKMIIVVFNEALVEYIRHVLPALGVEGVQVTTYRRWSAALLRRLKLKVPPHRTEATPEAVTRFKKHPVVIRMIERQVAESLQRVRESLEERLDGRDGSALVLANWDEHRHLPAVARVERTLEWVSKAALPGRTRAAAETSLRAARHDMRDIVGDWLTLFEDGASIRAAIDRDAKDEFSEREVEAILRWCPARSAAVAEWLDDQDDQEPSERATGSRRRDGGRGNRHDEDEDEDEDRSSSSRTPPALDGEDDAILLRTMQAKHGGIFVGNRRFEYEHVVIDEAQDLCPLEVRVLLDCATEGRSVTIAGDKAQKMIFDNGFSDWGQLLADAGLPHVEIQPLKITYRSTRQVMELARHVLGPLHDPDTELIARDGAPVSYYGFGDIGEAVGFLADALRSLMAREPTASVALITRYPQQAVAYYEALRLAEVPRLRLVARQDFKFAAGIDVTDVRQVKGLEFDYVIVVDPSAQNYPDAIETRHLLHIASTRTAYQLWLVNAGQPSRLLPRSLVESGEVSE